MGAEDLIGRQVATYIVEAVIGKGSMTVVYRAVDGRNKQAVALKVLFPPPGLTEVQERFRREVEMVRRLDHPGIVSILDVGQVGGRPFIVMPLIRGGSLAERLRARGKLDETQAADLAWQVADALHYAHTQGIVHRDVKPSNILLAQDGQALLADFGVARALDDARLTQTGLAVGTPFYMAPEQAAGKRQIDGRADLYALGVVLFQLVTGQIPFQGSTPQVLHAHVYDPPPTPSSLAQITAGMEAVILRALAKDPADRFQTGAEMARALTQIGADPLAAQTQTQLEMRPQAKPRRFAWPATIILVALALGLAWRFGRPLFEPSRPPTASPTQIVSLASSSTVPAPVTDTPSPTPTTTASPSPAATASPGSPTPTTPGSEITATLALTYPPGTLIKGSGDGVFRVRADRRLAHVFDWETFLAFGFQEDDIVPVDDAVLAAWLPVAGELKRIIQDEDGVAYWVVGGQRWAIARWQEALKALEPSLADEVLLAQLPPTLNVDDLAAGTLLAGQSEAVYHLFEGVLRLLPPELIPAYGYSEADVVHLPDPVLFNANYQVGLSLTPLIQAEGTEEIFLLEGGRRRAMPPAGDALWDLGYALEDISIVPAGFADRFPLIVVTPVPVETPALACDIAPADFVLDFWQNDAGLSTKIGCPLEPAGTTVAAWQPFERGDILWRKDLSLIYMLPQAGLWKFTGDSWREGDPDFDPTIVAPDGLYQPVRGFGLAWREEEGWRDALGWGLTVEAGLAAQVQLFEGGFAFGPSAPSEDGPNKVFVLFNDRTFQLLELVGAGD